ncbi:hypothetical protein CR513_36333, partial [Mucuna pruriens]
MGNDGVTKVIGVGNVCLQINTGMKLWVYTLKSKDQVLEKFKHCQALVERQSDKKGETLYTTVHVINLNPAVALNIEVPDKIWFDKDVKYDHLRVFGCKTLMHVPKDERSKLDMKTRQCIFIEYGHDEYDYRMYDPVEKKLVRSRDVQFMENQTIEDIDKVKKSILEKNNSLSEIDPVRMLVHDLDTVDNNDQNGEQHNYGDQQLGDDFDVLFDDDAEEEQDMQRQSFTRYTSNEYVTLTDGEEPKCYQESKESEERSKHIDVKYHWIRDALDAKLLELAKVHTDNGVDMMTKKVPRGKFEACCEIPKLEQQHITMGQKKDLLQKKRPLSGQSACRSNRLHNRSKL